VRPQAIGGNLSAVVVIAHAVELFRNIRKAGQEFRSRRIVIDMRTADNLLAVHAIPREIGGSEGEVNFLGFGGHRIWF